MFNWLLSVSSTQGMKMKCFVLTHPTVIHWVLTRNNLHAAKLYQSECPPRRAAPQAPHTHPLHLHTQQQVCSCSRPQEWWVNLTGGLVLFRKDNRINMWESPSLIGAKWNCPFKSVSKHETREFDVMNGTLASFDQ